MTASARHGGSIRSAQDRRLLGCPGSARSSLNQRPQSRAARQDRDRAVRGCAHVFGSAERIRGASSIAANSETVHARNRRFLRGGEGSGIADFRLAALSVTDSRDCRVSTVRRVADRRSPGVCAGRSGSRAPTSADRCGRLRSDGSRSSGPRCWPRFGGRPAVAGQSQCRRPDDVAGPDEARRGREGLGRWPGVKCGITFDLENSMTRPRNVALRARAGRSAWRSSGVSWGYRPWPQDTPRRPRRQPRRPAPAAAPRRSTRRAHHDSPTKPTRPARSYTGANTYGRLTGDKDAKTGKITTQTRPVTPTSRT